MTISVHSITVDCERWEPLVRGGDGLSETRGAPRVRAGRPAPGSPTPTLRAWGLCGGGVGGSQAAREARW